MPDIFILCPFTGQAVLTGLNTETVIFETLPDIKIPIVCPHCGQTRYWKPNDAWVGQAGDKARH